ncbi:MAG: hypothetical protein KBT11_00460 [Treponema sp.]|nr:hypothetical protein [Candidatus Treponema equifaecale]
MTDVENLEHIIKSIFGVEKIIRQKNNSNKCISTLSRKPLNLFAKNFVSRLHRLYELYKSDGKTINEIAEKVKNIGESKNSGWAGPYSELVALDFYGQFGEFFKTDYISIHPVSEHKNSIPALIGHKETIDIDLCIHLRHNNIYTDVKSFNCIHQNILEEIFEAVEEFALLSLKKSVMIGVDNLSSIDYTEVKSNLGYEKRIIYKELTRAVSENKKIIKYQSKSGIIFTFRIQYTDTLTTVKEYSPFAMAEAYKFKFLDYGSKLLDNEYSIITMVRNSWFNDETVDFKDFNNLFYRSLARRTFIELNKMEEDAANHSSNYPEGKVQVMDVAQNLAGIIFIDDHSPETQNKNSLYNAFVYLNPNYKNKTPLTIRKLEKYFRNDMEIQILDFDDFKWDNY